MQTGPYDANKPNAWSVLGWCRLEVDKTADNKVTVTWKGAKILDNFQLSDYSIHKGRLILAGRTRRFLAERAFRQYHLVDGAWH